ncbi:MAG: 16S rRNA (guanine(966)-N(2))-methyltransferase RsmD [Ardenticatenaceae bacterium]|nr:16S rRNA (guanine(966)-N(2))-methyltransferase RsmD [Ardenticatenaceae bacterium]HBY94572.1 16S rRNA (guanine(966)-N(2))-methyltransferase RsmD [Chloroflexota bacterium]
MPRVIAGSARGVHLESPKGVNLRPMMDRVRGSLFDMLWSLDAVHGRVLDLFAGTGAVGIEALSRGADWADFVELNRKSCRTIERNLNRTGFESRGRVHCRRAEEVIAQPESLGGVLLYDLISVTPPYEAVEYLPLLERLAASPLVGPGTIVTVEFPSEISLPEVIGPLRRLRDRAYGRTRLSVYDYPMDTSEG